MRSGRQMTITGLFTNDRSVPIAGWLFVSR